MAIKNGKQAKKARKYRIIWTIIAYTGALMLGWIDLRIRSGRLSDPEYVMPKVILKLFHPVLAALLISGAIAAMISTADSLLITFCNRAFRKVSLKESGMMVKTLLPDFKTSQDNHGAHSRCCPGAFILFPVEPDFYNCELCVGGDRLYLFSWLYYSHCFGKSFTDGRPS
jgi:hypothetical protein